MRWQLVIALCLGILVLLTAAPAGSPAPTSARAPASCKYVIKIIHGYRHRVRVCHRDKPVADLSVSIASSLQQVTAGNQVAYTVALTNHGPKAADNVVLTVHIPADEAAVYGSGGSTDASLDCNQGSGGKGKTIECRVFTLEPMDPERAGRPGFPGQVFVSILAEPDEAGTLEAVAEVKADVRDPHPGDNRVSSPLNVLPGPASADLSVAVHGPSTPATVPEDFAETISVTNNGPSEATTAYATVLLPQGTTITDVIGLNEPSLLFSGICPGYYGSSSPIAILCWNTVASGETRTATIMLAASGRAPPNLETNVVLSSYTSDPNLSNNRATQIVPLEPFHPPPGVDIVASLKAPVGAAAGREFFLPLQIANFGGDTAHEVQVTISATPEFDNAFAYLPTGGDVVIGGETTECSSQQLPLTCTIPTLESGDRIRGGIGGIVAKPGAYSVTVTSSSSSPETSPGNNDARASFDVKRSRALR